MLPERAVKVAEHPEDLRFRTNSRKTWRSEHYKAKKFRVISNPQHKGGVGKTTYAHTMAYALVRCNKKVLLVDADSQINLTQLVLGRYCQDWFEGRMERMLEHFHMHEAITVNNVSCETNLLSALEATVKPPCTLKPPCLWEINVADHEASSITNPQVVEGDLKESEQKGGGKGEYGTLYLLQGSANLESWNTTLSQAEALMAMRNQDVQKEVPGACYCMLQLAAYMYDIDFVIMDLNPGVSAFNKYAVMTSHDFIIPCGLDDKNRQALRSLPQRLIEWDRDLTDVRVLSSGALCSLPTHTPKFLGIMICRFNSRGSVVPYNQLGVLIEIQNELQNLFPVLRSLDMAYSSDFYASGLPPTDTRVMNIQGRRPLRVELGVVAVIPEYNTLQNMSERESIPVPFLRNWHLTTILSAVYEEWRTICEQCYLSNSPFPALPPPTQLYGPAGNVQDLTAKILDVRRMFNSIVELILNSAM